VIEILAFGIGAKIEGILGSAELEGKGVFDAKLSDELMM